jgi:hypothetical protein
MMGGFNDKGGRDAGALVGGMYPNKENDNMYQMNKAGRRR